MEINFNVGSLKIVYTPLMEYFKKIQGHVSQNLVIIRDEKKIATNHEAIDLLSKAQGTLKMIGLLGLVKVLLITNDALREIKDVKHDSQKSVAILEVVNVIVNNVMVYIDNLMNGEQDQPTKFYEQYAQLAKILGRQVSIKDLFMVKLDLKNDVSVELKEELRVGIFCNEVNKTKMLDVLHKSQSVIQQNISQMLKLLDSGFDKAESKQQYQNFCKNMYDAIDKIQNQKLSKNVYIVCGLHKLLICISSPIFNDDLVKILKSEEKDQLKLLILKIDRVVSSWIKEINELDESDKTNSVKADNDIVSDLLYYIIKSLRASPKLQDMPVLKELNSYFNFDFYVNLLKSTEIAYTLVQKNPEIVKAIEQNFLSFKEELTLLTDKESLPEDFLVQHITKLGLNVNKIHDNLNSVGAKDLNVLLNALSTICLKVKNKELSFNDIVQKEISLGTLLIEYGIKTLSQNILSEENLQKLNEQVVLQSKRLTLVVEKKIEELDKTALPVIDIKNKEKDASSAMLSLFEQLGKELEKAEKILDTYFRTEGENVDELKDVFKPLSSARGIFTIVRKPDLSKLVGDVQDIWKNIEANGMNGTDKSVLQKSIIIISGLSLLVNAEKEGNSAESDVIEARLLKNLNISSIADIKRENAIIEKNTKEIEVVEKVEFKVVDIEVVNTSKVELPVSVADNIKDNSDINKEVNVLPAHHHETLSTPTNSNHYLFEDKTNDPDMLEIYLMESEEVLENTLTSLNVLEHDFTNNAEITNIRRYFHTLKGSGRMVGLIYLGEAAWIVEQTLNKVVSGAIVLDEKMITILKETRERFVSWVKVLEQTKVTHVDVLAVKKDFETINDHITTINLDIPEDSSTLHIAESVVEKSVVENSTVSDLIIQPVVDEKINEEKFDFSDMQEDAKIDNVTDISLENLDIAERSDVLDGVKVPTVVDESSGIEDYTFKFEDEKAVENDVGLNIQENIQGKAEEVSESTSEEELFNFKSETLSDELPVNLPVDLAIVNQDGKLTEEHFDVIGHDEKNNEVLNNNVLEDSRQSGNVLENISEKTVKKHIIDGKEIDDELFNMFIEESEEHIKGLKEFFESGENDKINNNFIICAHTLSSISKAVNLKSFAKLVHKIELLSTLANDKDIVFDKIQLRLLRSIVNKLDFYKTTVHGVEIKEILFNEDISLLNDLQESLLTEKIPTISTVKESVLTVPTVSQEEEIDMKFKETVEESFSELKDSINKLQDDIRNLKESGQSNINSDDLVNTVLNRVQNQMDEQYENLQSLIKKNVHDNHEIVNELFSKVDNIETNVSSLSKQQKESDKNNREMLDGIRKEILGLGDILKKKSNGSYLEPFQEELTEKSLSEDVIRDGKNGEEGSLTSDVLAVLSNENFLDKVLASREKNVIPKIGKASLFISNNEFIKTIFEDTVSNVEDDIDDDIYEIAKEESDNMLDKIDTLMESISDNFNVNENNELKRYLHTLKGSVRMAGANKIGSLAHRLETILDYSESRKISLSEMRDLLDEEIDKIKFLIKDVKKVLTKEQYEWLDRKELNDIVKNDSTNTVKVLDGIVEKELVVANSDVVQVIKKEEKQNIKVNSELIDSLINEAGEIRLTRTTLEGMIENEKKSLSELKSSSYKLLKMLKEVEIQAESQIQAGKDKFNEDHAFDPLEFDRYTRLQELTRFMNEIVADIQDTAIELDGFNKIQNTTISNQTVLTNNVLDSLMKVRLVPFNLMSNRLYKVTRETAKELGKKVVLELQGENTEFDRLVLDRIITPIDHLLRNSIAHGVELPENRKASGKDSTGVIKVSTQLDGNFIVIKLEDDGAGINVDRIKEIGLKKGLLLPGKEYSKEEIIDLIFNNGFSTADAVSKVSGRGVGMDIVKNDVSALNGTISISTQTGKGTIFTIVLPVALATNHAMLSENLGKLVAIPAILVNEVVSFKKNELLNYYKEGFVQSRNKQYKLVYMGHLIGELGANQMPEIKNYNSIILINYLNEDLAVHVDKLYTTNEILIKKIGTHLSKVNGLLGVTLLGDGKQGIIVNPIMLNQHYENTLKNRSNSNKISDVAQKQMDTISIMVVDDSITVRRVTSKVLEKYKFNVILAKDGEDALEQLQISTPDLILSDIEMPNMDGFEFLKNLKNADKYKNIPIVMITSRTADKHKNYAFELGCDEFLGKPFQEEELVGKINELLNKRK